MTDMSPQPRPGPGPKPAGPTHPTPTGPPRGNGHALPPLPRRGEQIRDAERLGAQMLAVLQRTCDPASDPSAEDDPTGLGYVAIRLMSARADVRSALSMLSQITDLDLPPAGSAVRIPGPPLPDALDEGDGPPSHRGTTGDGPTPGHTDAAATASCESPGGPPSPGAGDSSDPRPRLSQRAPIGNGVRPGAGFTLPQSKRFLMPGAEEIAEQINASIVAERATK